jgi:hypothetical protein
MRLTEDDAKTKLCPNSMAQVDLHGHGVVFEPVRCVASECMAWRWSVDSNPDVNSFEDIKAGKPTYIWDEVDGKRRGYCGLAGEPR